VSGSPSASASTSTPGTEHITLGAGDGPCAILMFGSPDPSRAVSWIANDLAAMHGEDLPPVERVGAPDPFA